MQIAKMHPLQRHTDTLLFKYNTRLITIGYTYHARTHQDDPWIDVWAVTENGNDISDDIDNDTWRDIYNAVDEHLFLLWREQ